MLLWKRDNYCGMWSQMCIGVPHNAWHSPPKPLVSVTRGSSDDVSASIRFGERTAEKVALDWAIPICIGAI